MSLADAIERLGIVPEGSAPTNVALLVKQFELAFYQPLPDDYRAFLLANGRGMRSMKSNLISPLREGQSVELSYLYGFDGGRLDLLSANNTYKGRLPPGTITIGMSTVDQICLDVNGLVPGSVFYWDHEGEVDTKGNKTPDYVNTFNIATSFTNLLKKASIVEKELRRPSGVKKSSFRF